MSTLLNDARCPNCGNKLNFEQVQRDSVKYDIWFCSYTQCEYKTVVPHNWVLTGRSESCKRKFSKADKIRLVCLISGIPIAIFVCAPIGLVIFFISLTANIWYPCVHDGSIFKGY